MLYVALPSGHSLTSIPSGSYSATIVHACGYLGEELPSSFTSATRTPLKDTEIKKGWSVDNLLFLKTYRTTGLPVRNNPLTNIPKGFSSEMTLEVAEGRLQVPGLCMLKTHAICLIKCFFAEKWMQFK